MNTNSLILNFMSQIESADPSATAFTLYNGVTVQNISFSQFHSDILQAAGFFKDKKICGQHIGLIAPDSYLWMIAFWGIIASGNIAVLMNPILPASLLLWQCEKADVAYLCSDQEHLSLMSWNPQLPTLAFEEFGSARPMKLEEVFSADNNETIIMMFTSGTTGISKAAELTSLNLLTSIHNIEPMYDDSTMDRVFPGMPLFHIGGLRYALASLYRKKTVCIGRGLKYMLMDFAYLNPTTGLFVPATVETVSKVIRNCKTEQDRAKYLGTKFRRFSFGGAILKPHIVKFMLDKGYIMEAVFGMTETASDGTVYRLSGPDDVHLDTIGKLCGNMQAKIQDGELLLKCSSIMKGYYKDPEETAKVMDGGWMHTGDLARVDEDGFYYLTGRKKNVIILSNGENVNPEEIEATFALCDAIQECMVYSDVKGICADIYTTDQNIVAAFVKAYNESTPAYRQVYKINYMDQPLEKTPSGKIKRKENQYV